MLIIIIINIIIDIAAHAMIKNLLARQLTIKYQKLDRLPTMRDFATPVTTVTESRQDCCVCVQFIQSAGNN